MEIDTGAGLSCIPFSLYREKFSMIDLEPTTVKLKTYSGEVVSPVGQIKVDIKIQDMTKRCGLIVVSKATKVLLGRDIFSLLKCHLKILMYSSTRFP